LFFDFLIDFNGKKQQPKKLPEAKVSIIFFEAQKCPKPKPQHCQAFSFLKLSLARLPLNPQAAPHL